MSCEWVSSSRRAITSASPSPPPPRLRLLDLSPARVRSVLSSLGLPGYRADQLLHSVVHEHKRAAANIPTLPRKAQALLDQSFVVRGSSVDTERVSADGTIKWLVGLDVEGGGKKKDDATPLPAATTTTSPPSRRRLTVEAVFIPDFHSGAGKGLRKGKRRGTLCVSSQAGCSLACSFCHTGTQGLGGTLTSADIVEQALVAKERAGALLLPPAAAAATATAAAAASSPPPPRAPRAPSYPLTHIVFMGQGEPLLAWPAVSSAITDYLTHPKGFALAPRRITVSTSGIAPFIPRVATDTPGVRLAISLHAPTDALRSEIMSINRRWGVREVLEACDEYIGLRLDALRTGRGAKGAGAGAGAGTGAGGPPRGGAGGDADAEVDNDDDEDDEDEDEEVGAFGVPPPSSPFSGDRHNSSSRVRVSYEYVMLRGVNDSPACARDLLAALRAHTRAPALHAHVNLIPFNPWPGAAYACSEPATIDAFRRIVNGGGVKTTVRRSRGQDILGACGQLKSTVMGKGKGKGGEGGAAVMMG